MDNNTEEKIAEIKRQLSMQLAYIEKQRKEIEQDRAKLDKANEKLERDRVKLEKANAKLEQDRAKLERVNSKLENEKASLERERKEYLRRLEVEKNRNEQEKKLFDMKVKILQEELQNMAIEKEKIEKQKKFYKHVSEYQSEEAQETYRTDNIVRGDMFFTGVRNKQTLKKRYKDLLKIYHPDNIAGDNDTIQEINNEYSKLAAMYK